MLAFYVRYTFERRAYVGVPIRREKINRKKNLKYIISALVKVAQPINYPVNRLNRHSAARSMHANKLKHSLNIEKFIIL